MTHSTNPSPSRAPGTPGSGSLRTWNRRLHYYLGLYFLFFIWLFAFSGLLLNHSEWTTATFWERRVQSSYERALDPAPSGDDLAIARDVMGQLGIEGEINTIDLRPADERIGFQVVKPGRVFTVDAPLQGGPARIDLIELNAWGALDALHKLTGVSMTDPERERDWLLTRIWSLAMDGVAIGLIVLVLSGIYLWYRLPRKRMAGLVSLILGTLTCAFFLFGTARIL